MVEDDRKQSKPNYVKVVYFDEDSASDLVDLDAGGREKVTDTEAERLAKEAEGKISASFAAKYGWFSFLGAKAEVSGSASGSKTGSKIIEKSLSNTILTDYLDKISTKKKFIESIGHVKLTPVEGSMAHVKMFTPFMVIANTAETGIDLAKLDEALTQAKGYYELIASDDSGGKRVLRFNLKAFRNNYGLNDLCRMDLMFDCIKVGHATLESLSDEFGVQATSEFSANLILEHGEKEKIDELEVYDVILAGVICGD
ncbi:DUF6414 family protein [Corynebacterium epidermidicanis]|uniref:Uncharacterized protein n=1 Tax=Corynebacterium epidermidicanis TaxID=1050174 RepID=A0A0G3GZN4_9CORY|nr:DUF6414 family protein [Corynebacterium epidermidicanis]AKK04287.1 hypothetical protein CEPID_12325 [Corynebacterium epidermidicanis]